MSYDLIKLLLYLVIILASAKIGAEIFERINQPAVLGELFAGMVLGNLILLNSAWNFFEPIRAQSSTDPAATSVDMLAQLGIIILLFEVGLESSIHEMRKVGVTSFFVATVGVLAPFVLGYFVAMLFIREVPEQILSISPNFDIKNIYVFIGAVLTATSVGITARVFKDIGKIQTKEAQIVLGAAVIDDVLGLIILASVTAIVSSAESGTPLSFAGIIILVLLAVGFLAGSLVVGALFIPKLTRITSTFRTKGLMLTTALLICFGFAALAGSVKLAPIVGAFAGGLILEEIHFKDFVSDMNIKTIINPITTFLAPIFFVQMGIQVHLESFMVPTVLGISIGLIIAAVIGKQACGAVVRKRQADRLTVGIGMIPRGEVGLIFAGIGKSLGVINDEIFSGVVVMVIVTTFLTPPLLKWSLTRIERRQADKEYKTR
jgi:Kef-type K+ transport system membrane component KefB